jgi:hypothetical protein
MSSMHASRTGRYSERNPGTPAQALTTQRDHRASSGGLARERGYEPARTRSCSGESQRAEIKMQLALWLLLVDTPTVQRQCDEGGS